MKRFVSLLLAVCMVMSFATTALATNVYGGNDYNIGNISVNGLVYGDRLPVGATLTVGQYETADLTFNDSKGSTNKKISKELNYNAEDKGELELESEYKDEGVTARTVNDTWVVESGWDSGRVTLYPEYIATLTFDYQGGKNAEGNTKNTETYVKGDGLKALAFPAAPTRDHYEFEGWFTEPKIAENLNAGEKMTTESTFSNTDITLYAHWKHVHDWEYDASADKKTLYIWCNNQEDDYDECNWYVSNATDSDVTLVLAAEDATYDGEPYDTQYIVTKNNLPDEIEEALKEKFTFYLDAGHSQKTTKANSGANEEGGAPVKRGTYYVVYDSGLVDADLDPVQSQPAPTLEGSFSITMAEQDAEVKMGDYTYGAESVTAPSITDVKEDAAKDVVYYYSDSNDTSDLAKWTKYAEKPITGTTLQPGDYYMCATLPKTENYEAYTTPATNFHVTGATMKGITSKVADVEGVAFDGIYDGNAHPIEVTVPDTIKGYTIMYGETEGTYDLTVSPSLTDVGSKTVYYKVSAPGYYDFTGKQVITITGKKFTNIKSTGYNGYFDGKEHTVVVTGYENVPGAVVTFRTANYTDFVLTKSPVQKDVGFQRVYFKVSAPGYTDWFGENFININAASFEGITAEGYDGLYDGETHTVTVTVPNAKNIAGLTIEYGDNGDNYNLGHVVPTQKDVGGGTIYYKVSAPGYNDYRSSCVLKVSENQFGDITATGYNDLYDGNEHTVTVDIPNAETIEDLKIEYSNNGGKSYNLGTDAPVQKDVGGGTIYYKVSAPGYKDVTGQCDLIVIAKEFEEGSISAEDYDGIYDGKEHGIVVTTPDVDGLEVKYRTEKTGEYLLKQSPTQKDVGSKTVYYKVSAPGYNPVEGECTITVNKKELTPEVAKIVKIYDGTDAATLKITVPGVVDGESLTIDVPAKFESKNVVVNANGTSIAQNVEADTTSAVITEGNNKTKADNYSINWANFENLEGTIKKLAAEFTWSETDLPYTGKEQTVTATVANAIDNDDIELNYRDEKVNGKTYTYKATNIGSYYAQVTEITGADSVNYKLPAANKRVTEYNISFITGVCAQLSGRKTSEDNEWYVSDVTLCPPDAGYLISADGVNWDTVLVTEEGRDKKVDYYLKRISDGGLTGKLTEVSLQEDINIDKTAPTATIEFKTNEFKEWINSKFNYFFKNKVDVTITATDETETLKGEQVSGVKSIVYQKVADAADYDANGTWTTYDGPFSVDPNQKFIIYAKVTDNAGNVTIINSDGTVVYTDSTPSDDVTYTRLSKEDKKTKIDINDNTIYSMTIYSAADETKAETKLTSPANYTVNSEKKIVLDGDYLDTLAVGAYTIEVQYNPYGVVYDDTVNPNNDAPEKSIINLTVVKIDQDEVKPEAPTMKSNTKTSITLNEIAANGTSGAAVEYSIDNGASWQDSTEFTGLTSGKTYSFIARYKETADYKASGVSDAAQFSTVASTKRSSGGGGGSSTTYYTVRVTAGANGTADPSSSTVRSGGSKTLTFKPNSGYAVADVVVNGKSVGARTSYTLTNVTSNTTVSVTFVKSGNAVVTTTQAVINPSTGAAF